MRSIRILAALLMFPVLGVADDHTVNSDATVDFSTIKAFAIRETKSASQKYEFNNRLFLKKVAQIVRADLLKKGLEENAANPDLLIDFNISTRDYSTVESQRGYRVPDGPGGQRGYVVEGTGPQPKLFNEATISLDFTMRTKNALGAPTGTRNTVFQNSRGPFQPTLKSCCRNIRPKRKTSTVARTDSLRLDVFWIFESNCRTNSRHDSREDL